MKITVSQVPSKPLDTAVQPLIFSGNTVDNDLSFLPFRYNTLAPRFAPGKCKDWVSLGLDASTERSWLV